AEDLKPRGWRVGLCDSGKDVILRGQDGAIAQVFKNDGFSDRYRTRKARGTRFVHGEAIEVGMASGRSTGVEIEQRIPDPLEGAALEDHGELAAEGLEGLPIGAVAEGCLLGE